MQLLNHSKYYRIIQEIKASLYILKFGLLALITGILVTTCNLLVLWRQLHSLTPNWAIGLSSVCVAISVASVVIVSYISVILIKRHKFLKTMLNEYKNSKEYQNTDLEKRENRRIDD